MPSRVCRGVGRDVGRDVGRHARVQEEQRPTSSRSLQLRQPCSSRRDATRLIGMGRQNIQRHLHSSDWRADAAGRQRRGERRARRGMCAEASGSAAHRVDAADVGDLLVVWHVHPLLGVDQHTRRAPDLARLLGHGDEVGAVHTRDAHQVSCLPPLGGGRGSGGEGRRAGEREVRRGRAHLR